MAVVLKTNNMPKFPKNTSAFKMKYSGKHANFFKESPVKQDIQPPTSHTEALTEAAKQFIQPVTPIDLDYGGEFSVEVPYDPDILESGEPKEPKLKKVPRKPPKKLKVKPSKGPDLEKRVPPEHETHIPPLDKEDEKELEKRRKKKEGKVKRDTTKVKRVDTITELSTIPTETLSEELKQPIPTPEHKPIVTPLAKDNPKYKVNKPKYNNEGKIISVGGTTGSPGYKHNSEHGWTYNGFEVNEDEVPIGFLIMQENAQQTSKIQVDDIEKREEKVKKEVEKVKKDTKTDTTDKKDTIDKESDTKSIKLKDTKLAKDIKLAAEQIKSDFSKLFKKK